jgi:signal transduction histidine kinase
LQSRQKVFLTFSILCIVPLLVISLLSLVGNLKFNETLLRAELEREVDVATHGFDILLSDRRTELQDLARSPALRKYIWAKQTPDSQPVVGQALNSPSRGEVSTGTEELSDVRDALAPLLRERFYATIALFSPNKRLLFVAEPSQPHADGDIAFRTTDLLADQIQPDEAVWTTEERKPLCEIASQPTLGKTLRCTGPVFENPNSRGALVVDLKIDSLVATVASGSELPFFGSGESTPRSIVIILDDSGRIVYHTNDALKHQQVNNSMPYFAGIANSMIADQFGTAFYTSSEGDKWLAQYSPLMAPELSLAVARNYMLLTSNTRRLGWLSVAFALLIGAGAAVLLSRYYLRKTQSIDRVAEGVGAIAGGHLDHHIDLQSSDDLRPLADNLGLMTKQLRDQIAREAETRQFQSFVRLSAILTHDLKNAIEALSLTVANMEWHFDNKEFRADAMKSVTGATNNLRALVARLTNPMITLSGEHKRPQPVDLVPMLRQVTSRIAEPARGKHDIKIDLPESLFAFVAIERLDKIVENLIINALEAMNMERGTLSIAAGTTEKGKPFFSVSDTGAGISQRFIEEKLFRPFATTKKRGVGLGLYTCREVVVANGGSIEVDSQQGTGTTFRVVLPSTAIDQSGEKQRQSQSHS